MRMDLATKTQYDIPRFRYNLTKDSGTFEQNSDQGRYLEYHTENKEIQLVELI